MTSQPTPTALDGDIDGDIEDVLADLDDLDAVPVTGHVARFHALHESLTAALAGIDEV
jgi:hypothetical protein